MPPTDRTSPGADDRLHFEPFVHLGGLTHDDVLVAWGGFWFERPSTPDGPWRIIEDPDLHRAPGRPRTGTIGASSTPYGHAEVEVRDERTGDVAARATTDEANHVWLRGLRPDTRYRYRVVVDDEPWAAATTRSAVVDDDGTFRLVDQGRRYDLRFRTFPAPDQRVPVTFAALGDYGVGILASGGRGSAQHRVAQALDRAVTHLGVRLVVTTGDNIYLGDEDSAAGTGRHDDDWYFSFYEPYRHVISRVPVLPTVGNHDAADTEHSDDRDQLDDNLFTAERFVAAAEQGRASVGPGLFYRFDVGADLELVAIDTTLAADHDVDQFFQLPEHRRFLDEVFPADGHSPGEPLPRWRIPFSHHPAFCAGPSHDNLPAMVEELVPRWERSGVRLVLAGHEHQLQVSRHHGITYVITGAGGKVTREAPTDFARAHTRAWAAEPHLCLVTIDGDHATVLPVSEVADDGTPHPLRLRSPDGAEVATPIRLRSDLGEAAGVGPPGRASG